MALSSPVETMAVLSRHGFTIQKKYGQNFLIDGNIVEKIVGSANLTKDDLVLEIGPGLGTMTQLLCEQAREVIAVEIDTKLIPVLEDTLSSYDNVTVINEDVLKVDLKKLVEEKNGGRPIKVVANLPYYITTPILMELLESQLPIASITVMVQKEVAQRMQQGPGSKEYGALSLAVQYYTNPYIVCEVPASCFMPKPNVDSSVICLETHENPPVQVKDSQLLFKVIRASFNQRRKTLMNGLSNSNMFPLSKEELAGCIEEAGFAPTIRGEALTLEEFGRLSDIIFEKINK